MASNLINGQVSNTGRQASPAFLSDIAWREDAPAKLVRAAAAGKAGEFVKQLRKSWPRRWRRKEKRAEVRSIDRAAVRCALLSREAFPLTDRERRLFDAWTQWPAGPDAPAAQPADRKGKKSRRTEPLAPAAANPPTLDGARNGLSSPSNPDRFGPRFRELTAWADLAMSPAEPVTAAELLVLLDILECEGTSLPDELLLSLWYSALRGARALARFLDAPAGAEATFERRLIVLGELPWKAGLLFGAVEELHELRDRGREFLCRQLREQTDSDGVPLGPLRENWPAGLVSLIRSAAWGESFESVSTADPGDRADAIDNPLDQTSALFVGDDAERYDGLLRTAIMLLEHDGRLALATRAIDPSASVFLLETGVRLTHWKKKSRPRQSLRAVRQHFEKEFSSSGHSHGKKRREPAITGGKRPAFQSDEGLLACLRTNWSPEADRLAIAHDVRLPRIALAVLGQAMMEGDWGLEIQLDGVPVTLGDSWKPTCWFSDDDADYLEIQQILPNGLHIERQMLVAREGHFAVLADCISHAGNATIDYRSTLPIASDVAITDDDETRELRLNNGGTVLRAFPAALDPEKIQSVPGTFAPNAGRLQLEQTAVGGLFAPLVFDWHPDRTSQPADWKKLTIAEQGRTLTTEDASGHRVRIDKHQIVIYRSVKRSEEMRTVLGIHTANETLIGHFDSDGDFEPLVMVE